jgi:1-acyl-sn-glycerol-3-phosphate acyltransferase
MWWQISRLMLSGLLPQIQRAGRVGLGVIYAAYAWILFVLLIPIVWLLIVLLPGVSLRWKVMRAAARFLASASGIPFSVQGLEYLLPHNRSCILVSNHASYIDNFILVAALPREFSFVAKKELNQSFLTRLPLSRIRAEFVERFDRQKGIEDARRMAHVARSGQSLLFYPEGTFTRMPGLLPFHMGAFVAAVEGKAPVIPIAIRGTRSILRPGSWIPRRGVITVTICKPIKAEELIKQTSADPWAIALKLRSAVREQVLRFSGEPDLALEKSPI